MKWSKSSKAYEQQDTSTILNCRHLNNAKKLLQIFAHAWCWTYIENLIFNIFNRIFHQNFDSFSARVGHEAAIDFLDLWKNLIYFQFVDEGSNRLKDKFDVIDGVTLFNGAINVERRRLEMKQKQDRL